MHDISFFCLLDFISEKPLHGKLRDFSNSFGALTYVPNHDFMGTDFFTFKVQLGSLSSNLATVAIIVDDDLTKARQISEQRKQGVGVLHNLRKSLTPGMTSGVSTEVKSKTSNPLAEGHYDKRNTNEGVELGDVSNRGRGRSLTKSHQVNESVEL